MNPNDPNAPSPSPSDVTQEGNEIYLNELKDKLERKHLGEYVVIEVESKKHFINPDLTKALEEATQAFPNKIFHIIKIGDLQRVSQMKSSNKYGWLF